MHLELNYLSKNAKSPETHFLLMDLHVGVPGKEMTLHQNLRSNNDQSGDG